MASLPRAVQKQVEAAEALLGEMNKPVVPDTSLEDAANQADIAVLEAPAPTEPQTTALVQAPSAPAPAPQPSEDWEHKFKVLQGMFNAEMPRLQKANKELNEQLRDTLARLESLEQAKTQPQAPKEPEPLSDPRDAETFGADLVEMVTRIVTRAVGSVAGRVEGSVAAYEARLKQIEQALTGTTQTVAATAEEQFFDRLAKMVPDWEQINADPQFLAWLSEVDPVYGQPRQNALTAAQQALDAKRAAAIFQAFKPATPAAPAAPSVDSQVSPRARSSAPPAPQEKPVFSQAQVAKFYRDVQAGLYRGRESEMQKLEAVINLAIAEGRVR